MFKPHFPLLLDIKMRFLDSDNNSTIIGSLWQVWLGWTEDLPAGDLEAFLQLLLHLSASFPHSSSRTYPPFPPTKASAKTWLKFLGHSRPSYASPHLTCSPSRKTDQASQEEKKISWRPCKEEAETSNLSVQPGTSLPTHQYQNNQDWSLVAGQAVLWG